MTLLFITSVLAVGWVVVAVLLCLGLCARAAEGDRTLSESSARLTRRGRFTRAQAPTTF